MSNSGVWNNKVKSLYKLRIGQGYYIHHYFRNINRIYTHGDLAEFRNFNLLTNEFKSEKDRAKMAMTRQYKNLFLQNIKSPKTNELLELVADPDRGNKFLSELNEGLQKDLQNQLDINEFKSFHQEMKNLPSSKNPSLTRYLQKSKVKQGVEILDKYIESIGQSIQMLNSAAGSDPLNFGAALIALSNQSKQVGGFTSKQYGSELQKIVNQYKNTSNGTIVNQNKIRDLCNDIETLARYLKTGKDADGKNITSSTVHNFLQKNFFSGTAGEWLFESAIKTGVYNILHSVQEYERTGSNKMSLQLPDYLGNSMSQDMGNPQEVKADFKLKNASVGLSQIGDYLNGMELIMDIGVSNKLYSTAALYNPITGDSSKSSFSLGGGMNVRDAINFSFNTENKKYLAYNTFAWETEPELSRPLIALQDVLFKRSLINIAGARHGAEDFAMFLLINGEFIPLWDLIQLAANQNLGFSSSLGSNSPLVFSISTTHGKVGSEAYEQSKARGLIKVKNSLSYKYKSEDFSDKVKYEQYSEKVAAIMQSRANFIYDGLGKARISAYLNPSKLKKLKGVGWNHNRT